MFCRNEGEEVVGGWEIGRGWGGPDTDHTVADLWTTYTETM